MIMRLRLEIMPVSVRELNVDVDFRNSRTTVIMNYIVLLTLLSKNID